MITMIIRHTVADYAKWRPVFDADAANRKAAGATGVPSVYRDLANPNKITVVLEWDSAEERTEVYKQSEAGRGYEGRRRSSVRRKRIS